MDAIPLPEQPLCSTLRGLYTKVGIAGGRHSKLLWIFPLQETGDGLTPTKLWTTLPEASISSRELLHCGCKKGCSLMNIMDQVKINISSTSKYFISNSCLVTSYFYPACAVEQGKVIGVGVLICNVYIQYVHKWHFSGRLTFSNTRSRLLVEFIDYVVLLLHAPEMLLLLSKVGFHLIYTFFVCLKRER